MALINTTKSGIFTSAQPLIVNGSVVVGAGTARRWWPRPKRRRFVRLGGDTCLF